MKILAIIPARGGSKRLPRKNIISLEGKPLIAWTIEETKKSKYITDIIVSTDDEEIAKIAKEYNVSVPFIRPDYLSNDKATSYDVVIHAIDFLRLNKNMLYDYVILLQPTSPLRTVEDIDGAIEMLISRRADSIISMCECEHPPIWSNTLPNDLSIINFDKKEYKNLRSQDIPQYFRYNGAIYLTKISKLIEEKDFIFDSNSYAYIMPQSRSIDIDNKLDLLFCKTIIKEKDV